MVKHYAKIVMILSLITIVTACSTVNQKPIVIHPINDDDIFQVPIGAIVRIPAGAVMANSEGKVTKEWKETTDVVVQKQGRYFSEFYINEIIKIKAE